MLHKVPLNQGGRGHVFDFGSTSVAEPGAGLFDVVRNVLKDVPAERRLL
jgi:hypothetical protein